MKLRGFLHTVSLAASLLYSSIAPAYGKVQPDTSASPVATTYLRHIVQPGEGYISIARTMDPHLQDQRSVLKAARFIAEANQDKRGALDDYIRFEGKKLIYASDGIPDGRLMPNDTLRIPMWQAADIPPVAKAANQHNSQPASRETPAHALLNLALIASTAYAAHLLFKHAKAKASVVYPIVQTALLPLAFQHTDKKPINEPLEEPDYEFIYETKPVSQQPPTVKQQCGIERAIELYYGSNDAALNQRRTRSYSRSVEQVCKESNISKRALYAALKERNLPTRKECTSYIKCAERKYIQSELSADPHAARKLSLELGLKESTIRSYNRDYISSGSWM